MAAAARPGLARSPPRGRLAARSSASAPPHRRPRACAGTRERATARGRGAVSGTRGRRGRSSHIRVLCRHAPPPHAHRPLARLAGLPLNMAALSAWGRPRAPRLRSKRRLTRRAFPCSPPHFSAGSRRAPRGVGTRDPAGGPGGGVGIDRGWARVRGRGGGARVREGAGRQNSARRAYRPFQDPGAGNLWIVFPGFSFPSTAAYQTVSPSWAGRLGCAPLSPSPGAKAGGPFPGE